MQGFLATITTAFTPQVLFAMLGGFIGALISSDRKRYGRQLSLLFMVVACLILSLRTFTQVYHMKTLYRFLNAI